MRFDRQIFILRNNNNMMLLKYTVLVFFICITNASLYSQQQTESINEGSINEQFEFVIRKSTNWKDEKGRSYEVVRRNMMVTLKSHTLDSLNAVQAKLNNSNNIVSDQKKEISTLKTELLNTQETLASTIRKKDSMVLLGVQMSKKNYNLLVWSIIAALLALLLLFVFRFKNSNVVTRATKKRLIDIENEFMEYKRVALGREQKIKRQLQDEINKNN